jgi:hypothetical protein
LHGQFGGCGPFKVRLRFGGNGTLSNNSPSQIVVAGRVNPSATIVGAFAIGDPATLTVLYSGTLAKSSTAAMMPMFRFSAPLPQIHSHDAAR